MPGATLTPGDSVNFRLGLPRVCNRKFYFQGTGGFAVLSFGASTRRRATATNKETAMRLLAGLGPTLGPDGRGRDRRADRCAAALRTVEPAPFTPDYGGRR
jgi:hypothetical protein